MLNKTIRLDIGCGKNPRKGYIGIDMRDFGQEKILDIRKGLPYANNSVDEIYCSHFIEHLDQDSILNFLSECYAKLKKGGLLWIIVPHKDQNRAYILQHKTFFNEYTFEDLERGGKWKRVELIKNERPDIHWKVLKV